MFLANRKLKLIFLPFLYALFGCISGLVNGFILCRFQSPIIIVAAALAAIYISVPYSLSKRRTLYLAIMQACIICYSKLSRNNRISPILVVCVVCWITWRGIFFSNTQRNTSQHKSSKDTLGRWGRSNHNSSL